MKLLTMVLSCKKHQHLWPAILERNIPDLFILCGSDQTKLDGRVLYLKCIDTYDGLSEKIMAAYEYLLKYDFTHILKADDHDTQFSLDDIQNIHLNYNEILNSKDYIGQSIISPSQLGRIDHSGKIPKESIWYNKRYDGPGISYHGGGETYILSKHAVELIVQSKNEYVNYGRLEDVMVGSILLKHNIYPFQLNYGIKTWIG